MAEYYGELKLVTKENIWILMIGFISSFSQEKYGSAKATQLGVYLNLYIKCILSSKKGPSIPLISLCLCNCLKKLIDVQ